MRWVAILLALCLLPGGAGAVWLCLGDSGLAWFAHAEESCCEQSDHAPAVAAVTQPECCLDLALHGAPAAPSADAGVDVPLRHWALLPGAGDLPSVPAAGGLPGVPRRAACGAPAPPPGSTLPPLLATVVLHV